MFDRRTSKRWARKQYQKNAMRPEPEQNLTFREKIRNLIFVCAVILALAILYISNNGGIT